MESIDPSAYTPALGSTFVRELTDRDKGAALRIGRDAWSRHEVGERLRVVHTRACAILSAICRQLKVQSTRDLYNSTSPYTFADYPAGVTTLYVMFAAFRDKDLDPDAWYAKGQEQAIVSFFALKHREQVANQRTRADQERRQRRDRTRRQTSAVNKILSTASDKP
jgi:hypothetical protein